MNSSLADDYIIFKVCLSCGFDTLMYPNRSRHRGASFKCLDCEAYTFVVACSECMYESSADCSLTQLLGRKREVHEADNREKEVRGRPRKCSWESEDKDGAGEECEGGSPPMGERERDMVAEQSPIRGGFGDQCSEDAEGSFCPHCSQELCRTCEPGYMKIIADMDEFSKTFAVEMRLCTLCDHRLCPGSGLIAFLRCMKCAHDECDGCLAQVDKMGEEWCVCCCCGKSKDEFVLVT